MTQWTTMTPEAHADWLAAYPRPYSGRMNLESEPRRIEHYDEALGTGEAGLISYGVQGPGGAVTEFAVRSSLIQVDAEPAPSLSPDECFHGSIAEIERHGAAMKAFGYALPDEGDLLLAAFKAAKQRAVETETRASEAFSRADTFRQRAEAAEARVAELEREIADNADHVAHADAYRASCDVYLARTAKAEARVAELEAVLNRAQAALIAGVPG